MGYATAGRVARVGCALIAANLLFYLAEVLSDPAVSARMELMPRSPIMFAGLYLQVVACWYAFSRKPVPAVATLLFGAAALLLATNSLYSLWQLAASSRIPLREGIWHRPAYVLVAAVVIFLGSLHRILRRRNGRRVTSNGHPKFAR